MGSVSFWYFSFSISYLFHVLMLSQQDVFPQFFLHLWYLSSLFPSLLLRNAFVCCVLSHFSHVWLFATLWTVAHQTPLSMGFSRQEYWSGLPCLRPEDLSDPGVEPTSLMSPALASGLFNHLDHDCFTQFLKSTTSSPTTLSSHQQLGQKALHVSTGHHGLFLRSLQAIF